MKNIIVKFTDKLVDKTLKMNINSTTSIAIYQPEVPKKLFDLSKVKWLINLL